LLSLPLEATTIPASAAIRLTIRTGVGAALGFPAFAAARTGCTEADLTESADAAEGVEAAIETDGAIKATTASAEMIFFINTSVDYE
jgi:hypothetical protein